ncbi:uncharacterized protein LTR77_005519 [Saxophila tyrrhenica]|uniref:Carboxypeptidase n=1 Tax=Saxophila tyrrhenica TaxID=1690608 RepID=A0AAV9P963_9PEZI|nr:hypothetical protein LTR77_005519 [Saxophila tyrrhenica]
MARSIIQILSIACLAFQGLAQFPPTPEGITTLQSRFHPGITISYKQPGICETTPGVKSYAGYVHLPPNSINETHEDQHYPINTFFWFFEARKDPRNAPLAIWLNGGPGGSSMIGALAENGPCLVGSDSNGTYLNEWSWNNEVNVLYLDQPVQVGYSYDVLTNITTSIGDERFFGVDIQEADFSDAVPEQNLTFLVGTTGSQKLTHTANSTTHAAVALWHFAQTWFEEFPHYKPEDEQLSLFTESYGGHYGPAFVSHFMKQNELISNGTISEPGAHYLHFNTLGIVNGCIDEEAQVKAYATMAWNNTYDVKAFTEEQYNHAIHGLEREGGVIYQLRKCRRLQKRLDPNDHGDVERVISHCQQAITAGANITQEVYLNNAERGWFDITHPATDSFPPPYAFGFMNQHWVQKALGVPVNHSFVSQAVGANFDATADMARGGLLEDIAYILDHGVRVTMMYGDRDYACNWIGGEEASVRVPWGHQEEFAEAGYTPLVVSPVHSGGLTRQYGNLSFTRVYQAGHMVPSYQPEVAYEIFMRAVTGRDIATGTVDLREVEGRGEHYSTQGPKDTWWKKNDVLPAPAGECYLFDLGRCTEEEIGWVFDGTAMVKDWIVVGREEQASFGSVIEGDQEPLSTEKVTQAPVSRSKDAATQLPSYVEASGLLSECPSM